MALNGISITKPVSMVDLDTYFILQGQTVMNCYCGDELSGFSTTPASCDYSCTGDNCDNSYDVINIDDYLGKGENF